MTRITISAGHGLYVRGANGILDEVDEARRVVSRIAAELQERGIDVKAYWDDVSTTQNENLNRIVDWHNNQVCDLSASVHFNAYEQVSKPMGTEVLYVTQQALAAQVSAAIADSGFVDRGAKKRTDLFFLNQTTAPAILIEVCFVDSEADADIYRTHFDLICENIANVLGGEEIEAEPPPTEQALFHAEGPCSYFGGPEDTGIDSDEGLAFFYEYEDAPHLFLRKQPEGATGLARRLNPNLFYVACRWNYEVTPKSMLSDPSQQALVRAGGRQFWAWPADWGPHEDTRRVADLSPALMDALGLETDDEVEVIYPAMT
jgi:N-acetylmuramoyl-L-alanine amidase